MRMNATNVERLLPTNDKAVYVEASLGSGEIYSGLVKPFV